MKALLASLLLLTACYSHINYGEPRISSITQKQALGMSEGCYVTKQGLTIGSAYDTECPPKRQLEKLVGSLQKRVSLPRESVSGASVLFVREFIDCGDELALGCTGDEFSMVLLAGDESTWAPTFCHELGHVLLSRNFGDGDGEHLATEFWLAVEDCAR